MAAEVSESVERSEESETANGAESILFMCLVVLDIFVVDGNTLAAEKKKFISGGCYSFVEDGGNTKMLLLLR